MGPFFHLALIATAIFVSTAIIVFRMGFFRKKNHFPVDGLTAIVTGGSQGLGLAVAQELASKGANVVIVAQDQTKLEKAIESIRAGAARPLQQKFLQLSFDLRDPASAIEILEQVTQWNDKQPPDIVFCCAGHCKPGFFASTNISTLREQMDTIYWSSAYMAHAALSLWTAPSIAKEKRNPPRPTRHLIFTCSTLAFFPCAGYSPYSPAKAAMRALVDSLNQEVAVYNGARKGSGPAPDADIEVHTLFPMGILSPGLDNENKTKPELTVLLEKDDKPQRPEAVAKIAIDRLEAGDYMITTMLIGHLLRGCAMGGSLRKNFMDVFWNGVGSIIILFVAPDFISKCKRWGKQKGMHVSASVS